LLGVLEADLFAVDIALRATGALLAGACIMRTVMSMVRLGEIISLTKEYAEGKRKKERRTINPHRTAFGGGFLPPGIAAHPGACGLLGVFLRLVALVQEH
jgi:hypothetical protein